MTNAPSAPIEIKVAKGLLVIKPATSDLLCGLATGSGFRTRKLYSDVDEIRLSEITKLNGVKRIYLTLNLDLLCSKARLPPRCRP